MMYLLILVLLYLFFLMWDLLQSVIIWEELVFIWERLYLWQEMDFGVFVGIGDVDVVLVFLFEDDYVGDWFVGFGFVG